MAMPIVQVQGNIQWKVARSRDGHWLGICDPLRLTLQAETYAELMEDIGLALDAMLRDLLESSDLERFLRDQGWTLTGTIPARQDEVRFDVPFFLLPGNADGNPRVVHQ
jgi:hypothetical protein